MKICPTCKLCYEDADPTCVKPGHMKLSYARPHTRIIDNRYRLDRWLGEGVVSSVYVGDHLALEKPVAIKFLKEQLLKNQIGLKRLRREARITSRFSHPNLVTTYDFALEPTEAYIVMELIDGITLADYLKTNITPPLYTTAKIMRQVAAGVSAAHTYGVIHRDLKPANIMLTNYHGDLVAKVIDFGVAKLAKDVFLTEDSITPHGSILGTCNYLSPEACQGKASDERSDIYSFGVVLYRMLTGQLPFSGDVPAVVHAHVKKKPPHVADIRPDLPKHLVDLVMQCLRKSPSKRPQSADELANRLNLIESTLDQPPYEFSLKGSLVTSSRTDINDKDRIDDAEDTVKDGDEVHLAPQTAIPKAKSHPKNTLSARKPPKIIKERLPSGRRSKPTNSHGTAPSKSSTGKRSKAMTANKVRLYDLAKELKLETKLVIEEVRREGCDVSVPSNSISKELADKIRNKYVPERGKAVSHKSTKATSPAPLKTAHSSNTPSPVRPSPTPQSSKPAAPTYSTRAYAPASRTHAQQPRPQSNIPLKSAGAYMTLKDDLNQHLKTAKLFVDTSSLMHPDATQVFLGDVQEALMNSKSKLVVPFKVLQELNNNQRTTMPNPGERQMLAGKGKKILAKLDNAGIAEFYGDNADHFPDALFIEIFSRFRTIHPLSLITQDVSLMVDILSLQLSYSVSGIKPITVWEVDHGTLRKIDLATAQARLANQKASAFRFNKRSAVQAHATDLIQTHVEIGAGSVLRTLNHGPFDVLLEEKLDSGGEGDVYVTSIQGRVAKIYFPQNLTVSVCEKLKLMVSKLMPKMPQSTGICWPLDILVDTDGKPRGFLMDEARGRLLGTCVFNRSELEQSFKHWDRWHLVTLCITLLEKIQFLHRANIFIGDLNQWNIFVEDENSVFLIDTDSYQIEGFPCTVGRPHFTAPELQGADFRKILRTDEHESFAIATLLFMILHVGKPPYAQLGSDSITDNIKDMQFPYKFRDKTTRKAPDGPWKIIWNNLPYLMKQAFYETFHFDHRNQYRRRLEDWLYLLKLYREQMEKDFHTRELFPTSYKRWNKFAEDKFGNGYD